MREAGVAVSTRRAAVQGQRLQERSSAVGLPPRPRHLSPSASGRRRMGGAHTAPWWEPRRRLRRFGDGQTHHFSGWRGRRGEQGVGSVRTWPSRPDPTHALGTAAEPSQDTRVSSSCWCPEKNAQLSERAARSPTPACDGPRWRLCVREGPWGVLRALGFGSQNCVHDTTRHGICSRRCTKRGRGGRGVCEPPAAPPVPSRTSSTKQQKFPLLGQSSGTQLLI